MCGKISIVCGEIWIKESTDKKKSAKRGSNKSETVACFRRGGPKVVPAFSSNAGHDTRRETHCLWDLCLIVFR